MNILWDHILVHGQVKTYHPTNDTIRLSELQKAKVAAVRKAVKEHPDTKPTDWGARPVYIGTSWRISYVETYRK